MPYKTPGGGLSSTPNWGPQGLLPAMKKPSGSNVLSGFFDTLSQAGTGLANQLAGLSQASQQVDPLQALLESMAGDVNTGGSGLNRADYEQALNDSAAQIKKAFGAEIGAVRASSAAARKTTKRSKKQIRAMYRALSNDYKTNAADANAQGQQTVQQLANIAANTQGNVTQNADKILNEQASLAQNLGVQSASPDIIAKQQSKVQQQVNNMQNTAQNEQNLATQNAASQQRYMGRQASGSILEGTNQRADLVKQLQQFLLQNQGKIADIGVQRAQALGNNAQQMAASFSKGQSDAAQNKFDNEKALAGLLLQLNGQKNSSSGNGPQSDKNIPSWMKQQNAIIGNDSQVAGLLENLFSTPEFTQQQFQTKTGTVRMNPVMAGDLAYQAAKKAGLSDAQAIQAKLAAMTQQQALG